MRLLGALMSYDVNVLADSVNPAGVRLTTLEITFPRIVLAEFNTHRMLSRNSASSRAIPTATMLRRVRNNPFYPVHWGRNQKGMQAEGELTGLRLRAARACWRLASYAAVAFVWCLNKIGLHKQVANRLLEPWLWHTVIVTATDWENFFNLRDHKDAQPEMRRIARMMRFAMVVSEPRRLEVGEWHLPLVRTGADFEGTGRAADLRRARMSSARCARVSYLTHDGRRDPVADTDLAIKLQLAGHMSPFEHAAMAKDDTRYRGNFRGFVQFRKMLDGEAVFRPRPPEPPKPAEHGQDFCTTPPCDGRHKPEPPTSA
jgi:hypothetical protein